MHNGILLGHKNEILIYTTTNMDFENIMFSEINTTQKDKIMWSYSYELPRIGRFIWTEGRIEVTRKQS